MAQYPIGTATFTNGSRTVSVTNLDSGRLGFFTTGTLVAVGTNPQIAIVPAMRAVDTLTFELNDPWDLATGSYPFIGMMTSESVSEAVNRIRNISAEFTALSNLYETTADGIAATSDGDYFNVAGSGSEFSTLYQNDNGTAVEIAVMPTAAAINLAEQNAEDSAAAALQSEQNAAASEGAASTSAGEALASENKAQEWAENPEDVEVEPNAYSALHWAAKAEGFATSINPTVEPNPDTAVQRTSTGAVRGADAQNADELVALGQTGTAYSRDVGLGNNNIPDISITNDVYAKLNGANWGATGLAGFGYGGFALPLVTNPNEENALGETQFYRTGNSSSTNFNQSMVGLHIRYNSIPDTAVQLSVPYDGGALKYRAKTQGTWGVPLTCAILEQSNTFLSSLQIGADDNASYKEFTIVRDGNSARMRMGSLGEARLGGNINGNAVEFIYDSSGISSPNSLAVPTLDVSGSKNFRIVNPVNEKEYLYHSAIESDKPRTQYVLHVTVDSSLTATHTLPDWFYGLNGDTCTVFPAPCKHFGQAYGEVKDGVLTLTANAEGDYHVLIMAERSDDNVKNWKLTAPIPQQEDGDGSSDD